MKNRLKRRRPRSERTPGLVLVPATLAPVVLVAGWNLAGSAQSGDYDAWRESLSSLAGFGASHREIMTWSFALLGFAHLWTAFLLRTADRRGRVVLALGGLATIGVALVPLSREGESYGHAVVATVAFVALAAWSALAARTDGPRVLRPRVMRTASVVLGLLVLWFAVALGLDVFLGLAERVAALAQALWPLIVAWMVREWDGGGGTPPDEPEVESPEPSDEQPSDEEPSDPIDPTRPRDWTEPIDPTRPVDPSPRPEDEPAPSRGR